MGPLLQSRSPHPSQVLLHPCTEPAPLPSGCRAGPSCHLPSEALVTELPGCSALSLTLSYSQFISFFTSSSSCMSFQLSSPIFATLLCTCLSLETA